MTPEQKQEFEERVYRSLRSSNTVIPTPHVLVPMWMAEAYVSMSSFLKQASRLWLPKTSIYDKLPYHQCDFCLRTSSTAVVPCAVIMCLPGDQHNPLLTCNCTDAAVLLSANCLMRHPYYGVECRKAIDHPEDSVQLSDKLNETARRYRMYGQSDAFTSPYPLKRGKRFDMPEPGMKTILVADVLLTWALCNISM